MLKIAAAAVATAGAALFAVGSASAGPPTFSNQVLRAPATLPAGYTTSPPGQSGDSEPAIDFGGPGNTMAVDGLGWLPFQVNLWKGHFGDTTPAYFGAMDTALPIQGNGRINLGDGDADVEVTSAGTTLLTDLDIIFNKQGQDTALGVSVTRCPASAATKAGCTSKVLDTQGADRPWITTSGTNAWISYHDSGDSTLIHVWHSTDDGKTWTTVASPIPGQNGNPSGATFNNIAGPIVADPTTGYVYQVYAAGEASVQKGTSADYNNVYVARSTNGGNTWTTNLVYHAPLFTNLGNIFPALTVDPGTGTLYAAWSDLHGVYVSSSLDHGAHWGMPLKVSSATTTIEPWVAALNGKVDVVYYGSSASSNAVTNAVWNTYDSQFSGGVWSTGLVSNTPNRIGAVCLGGAGCTANRELLDLFEVAENPANGKAAVIYTDTTLDTWTGPDGNTHQLPEIVLAYEN
jgi:hypothetical protein